MAATSTLVSNTTLATHRTVSYTIPRANIPSLVHRPILRWPRTQKPTQRPHDPLRATTRVAPYGTIRRVAFAAAGTHGNRGLEVDRLGGVAATGSFRQLGLESQHRPNSRRSGSPVGAAGERWGRPSLSREVRRSPRGRRCCGRYGRGRACAGAFGPMSTTSSVFMLLGRTGAFERLSYNPAGLGLAQYLLGYRLRIEPLCRLGSRDRGEIPYRHSRRLPGPPRSMPSPSGSSTATCTSW